MSDDIHFDGVRFISASDAAERANLSRDYIARLCRDGKVQGRRVGKNWYVEPKSLFTFLGIKEQTKAERNEKLSIERRKEYHGIDISHEPAKILPKISAPDVGLKRPPARPVAASAVEQV